MAFPLPRSLSPSKVSSFKDCALAFRFSVIDHLPEPPSPHMVKGTLVHRALEGLFWDHPRGETHAEAARSSWPGLGGPPGGPRVRTLALSESQRQAFVADAHILVDETFNSKTLTPSTPSVWSSSSRPRSGG